MKKQFVSKEIALELKKLGFDEECFAIYNVEGNLRPCDYIDIANFAGINNSEATERYRANFCTAPLWQQTIDWLREVHNIDISIYTKNKDLGSFYGGDIKVKKEDYGKSYGSNFKTYEEALEAGLFKALKLISDDTNTENN